MYPLDYIEPVFRPPSEWKSLILQVTNGCSWNRCTFCSMYTDEQKKFRPKKIELIEQEIITIAQSGLPTSRVFLADGDAMMLPFKRLKQILVLIKQHLPQVTRVSSYCLPRNLSNKTVDELSELQSLGLKLLYVGCESGDDEVLTLIDKGETYQSSVIALNKIKQAGMKSSVMILNGLGGPELSEQHALNSARLMNETQPDYLSTLVVSFPFGEQRFADNFTKQHYQPFRQLTQPELFHEMEMLLETLELNKTIFRSDHASNYLVLKGILGKDKQTLLQKVKAAQRQPGSIALRQEWQRGL
ncbi:radical SAM protein [Psychrobium sp. 1_MG-2023]|uniref:radical SAM protein n=1 Tax=Psychrobium sp. 1_MG-2023 TaxID=3062624 RepID=UPI000C323052|nr:radical SAM protein [Psychrobium sp. 1_MG-2023]MDP2562327.1 radical SAM protein [Psychrobium sp. 1_MG-2023]PKF58063.1 radical SAM protein [Alteromonadales bacterium alter-6D02]